MSWELPSHLQVSKVHKETCIDSDWVFPISDAMLTKREHYFQVNSILAETLDKKFWHFKVN